MNASEYNAKQYRTGKLTDAMITELVECWQRHHQLTVDGFAGPNTLGSILGGAAALAKFYPLRALTDGRQPVITSGFYTENPSRSTHKGVDFFYKWQEGDPLVAVGDGGAIAKRGTIKWWYPDNTCAVSAADGVVSEAGNTKTGHRVWVDHGHGERTGYFHLQNCLVSIGQRVDAGHPLGLIGDNPSGHDGKHLHFEVSPVGKYAPINPRVWLKGAGYLLP